MRQGPAPWPPQSKKEKPFSFEQGKQFLRDEIKKDKLLTQAKTAYEEARLAATAANTKSRLTPFKTNPFLAEVQRLEDLQGVIRGLLRGEKVPNYRYFRDGEKQEKGFITKAGTIAKDAVFGKEHFPKKEMVKEDYERLIQDIKKFATFSEDLSSPANTFLDDYPDFGKHRPRASEKREQLEYYRKLYPKVTLEETPDVPSVPEELSGGEFGEEIFESGSIEDEGGKLTIEDVYGSSYESTQPAGDTETFDTDDETNEQSMSREEVEEKLQEAGKELESVLLRYKLGKHAETPFASEDEAQNELTTVFLKYLDIFGQAYPDDYMEMRDALRLKRFNAQEMRAIAQKTSKNEVAKYIASKKEYKALSPQEKKKLKSKETVKDGVRKFLLLLFGVGVLAGELAVLRHLADNDWEIERTDNRKITYPGDVDGKNVISLDDVLVADEYDDIDSIPYVGGPEVEEQIEPN